MFFSQAQNLEKGDQVVFFSTRRGVEVVGQPRMIPGNPPEIVFHARVLGPGNQWQHTEVKTPADTHILILRRNERCDLEQMVRQAGLLGGLLPKLG